MITLRRLRVGQYKSLQALDLAFPEQGSFLIEGRNEAGKSTLFDAVYFALYGAPLVGDLAEAIHYGGDELIVALDLAVGQTTLAVQRKVRRTAKTLRAEAEIEVRRGDDVEVVKGAGVVSRRLQHELGGLTAEALLNSCLVAQKQLGRLETLPRASREDALTILLNLGKLADVHGRLRLTPQDETELRKARARVDVAVLAGQLEALAARRAGLERQRRLIDLRDGAERLEAFQEELDQARAAAAHHEAHLAQLRQRLAQIEAVKAQVLAWQRVADVARRRTAAREELAAAERDVAQAQQAAAALPACRATLARFQQARDQAQALADCRSRLSLLAAEARRLEERLEERSQLAARRERLLAELDDLRRQQRDLAHSVMQLAPLATQLDQSRARLAALRALEDDLEALGRARDELEELELQAAGTAEAAARYQEAAAALAEARAALAAQETQRAAAEARRRRREVRDPLARWLSAATAAAAAAATRRLLADLALAVAGVQHVAIPNAEGAEGADAVDATGLRLDLIVDHPLAGGLALHLRLWSGHAELREVRRATEAEMGGLRHGRLPALGGAAAAGEPRPRDVAAAQARLAEIDAALAAPAPLFDEAAHRQALMRAAAAESVFAAAKDALEKLPAADALQREIAGARRAAAQQERACLAAARQCRLPAAGIETIAPLLVAAVEAEQARQEELQISAGRREGLQEQVTQLDRHCRERTRELEEYARNLAADTEGTLRAAQARVAADRAAVEAEAARLYAAITAAVESLNGSGVGVPALVGALAVTTGPGRGSPPLGGLGAGPYALSQGEGTVGALPPPPNGHDLAALRGALQRHVDALSGQAHVLERQAAALQDAESRAGAARAALAASGAELAAAWNEARAAGGEDAGTAEPNRASATRSAAPALADDAEALATERLAALYQELQALDEPATRAAEQEAQRAAGGADASLRRLGEDAGLLAGRLAALAGELGRDVSAPAEGAAAPGAFAALLREACPELVDALPAREALDGELRALDQQAGNLERGREDARVALGDEPPKALDEAERALADLQLDHAARRRAQEIVSLTRQRMIEKVLPDTIANMCLLLPLLTAGRYRHAELTPDYRLQVWDERKRGYVEKTLYSGGTQDQFSLALRLGFALAALPRELGTSPGFLFLDEPLSSFDRDRTAALIELLTRGQITTFFQQVFLISHSQAFDPDQFSYHIVMEDGRVAHSTLP